MNMFLSLTTLYALVIFFRSGECGADFWDSWGPWRSCSKPCGRDGSQTRVRTGKNCWRTWIGGEFCEGGLLDSQTRPCNIGCPHGGTPTHGTCMPCPVGKFGICCEHRGDYDVNNCKQEYLVKSYGYYTLSENHGAASDSICLALKFEKSQPFTVQIISVELWNHVGTESQDNGYLGVIFNAKTLTNYDLVYLRPHSTQSCYQVAFVKNGKLNETDSGVCPGGPPKRRQWFKIKVIVDPYKVSLYLNELFLLEMRPKFSPGGRVGVMLGNGYNNVIRFKNLKITEI